ncbi:putative membrane-bound serine protease [Candidatus Protochlamydia naegleriophila]|uniref:Putative membrane-bound serine protease n=1 Tax=Candidatus Protochlamydia naegleriophila TaxID=389348 RepID=A0A0U5EQS3_9BACT|nr:NfeD family protein [Candidatus Protochlamydia naegleriophila]CUI16515.1 putative membrane-bound serine protease [Candidatus Protochlamydia naegleriophila]
MTPFLLLFIGLLLILIEFYIPGAVMGVLGSIFVLVSILLFASQTNSLLAIVFFVLGTILCVGLLIRFALWRIVRAKPEYSIYLNEDQEGYQASSFDQEAIGKIGVVLSDLKPGGYILIDGKQHQAISLTGYIPKGEHVEVVSGQEESLIVKISNKET